MPNHRIVFWSFVLSLGSCLAPRATAADAPVTGLRKEVPVAAPTRLDWQFAIADFGADNAQVPKDYDSTKQRYQLFVPKNYDKSKAWPLLVFISPGDDPGGWSQWGKVCEDSGMLFCAAYKAGNNCPVGQRTRIVLDMLDDVRRHYRVDPDQTYLSGFSGGGRMACTIGFALPEYFGGVIPICGTNPLNKLTYLRHRLQDRVSVAFVTGTNDFNRQENEDYMAPMFQALGIRSKLWVVPKMGHGVPSPAVLAEVQKWLAEDLPRRQADAKALPGLAAAPEEVPGADKLAARMLETAEAELKQPEHTWRGVALLQGIVARWEKSEAGVKAGKRLQELVNDPKTANLIAEQGGKEERLTLTAQAQGLEKLGDRGRALKAWSLLARDHPDTPEGKRAAAEVKRLKDVLAATPYLGVVFNGETTTVVQLVPDGPAARAGLKPGDKITAWEAKPTAARKDIIEALAKHKPGDKVTVEVQRDGKPVTVKVELMSLPVPDDN